jgi:hypothetical protein
MCLSPPAVVRRWARAAVAFALNWKLVDIGRLFSNLTPRQSNPETGVTRRHFSYSLPCRIK